MTIDRIIKKFQDNYPGSDTKIISLAYDFAEKAHAGQIRKSGEPYIQHSLHTAYVLAESKMDLSTVAAGLLHDVPEDTSHTLEEIKKVFGEDIQIIVKGVTKLGKLKYRGVERYKENLKKMFIAIAGDLRIIYVKFADRLHNLRTLEALPDNKKERIAKETLEIYAPIAGLLGAWRLKWQMEDICFKYLFPEEYKKLEYKYEVEKKTERNQFFQKVKKELEKELEKHHIKEYSIEYRFKHLYSIWQKMQNKNRKFDEIYDVFALRVVVPSIPDCYKVLGIIHILWKPKINRFKDYIAVPKPNGYRSIHTTVFGLEGKSTEFQIRTPEMNDESLYGVAAHWHYKNHDSQDQPQWIKEILQIKKDNKDTYKFLDEIKSANVFQNRIFVFSPKGDVFELPEKATPVDFAYAVHTDIGNKTVGVLINDQHSALDVELKNGDLVDIITDKNRQSPSSNWLKFVKTRHAREMIKKHSKKLIFSKIKDYFSK
ncbi:MAG TPA: RelA/SpoT family protein [bacterium]|nr:RelA/SpoT family protein [bacterium]HPT29348.1 RelA/SpoT family protein [bacterium]